MAEQAEQEDRRQLTVRVSPRLYVVLKQLARQEKRSVSAQAAVMIEQGLLVPEVQHG